MSRFISVALLAIIASASRCLPSCSFCYFFAFATLCYRVFKYGNFFDIPLFYFFFSAVVLHWVYIPLTFSNETKLFIPFSVVLLPLYISLYYFAFIKICNVIETILKDKLANKNNDLATVIKIVFIVSLSEYCVSNMFTGFPWINTVYCWATSDAMLQITSIIGSNLLSIITILCAVLLGLSARVNSKRYFLVAITPIMSFFIFGQVRLLNNPTETTSVKIRCVQGNISQDIKDDSSMNSYVYNSYKNLSINSKKDIDIMIWPEACIPWIYSNTSSKALESYVQDICSECNVFITGAIRKNDAGKYYNSVIAFFDGSSRVLYDKVHLLPFGEYMPLRSILNTSSIAGLVADFSPGTEKSTISIKGISPFQICICYESIFAQEFVRLNETEWILNITNDGWFKNSNENFQHNNISRILSVENGLPTIRVNNVGISSVFDAYGRCLLSTLRGGTTFFDTYLPSCIDRTFYSRNKRILDNIGYFIVFCLYLLAILL